MNGLTAKPKSKFSIALGAVSCTFRRELLPYETYDMWTRVLTWDEKWFYIITHFVKRSSKIGPEEITLYPQQQKELESNPPSRKGSATSTDDAAAAVSGRKNSVIDNKNPVAATAVSKIVFKDERKTITPQTMLELAEMFPAADKDVSSGSEDSWTMEKMEAERLRGLEVLKHLTHQDTMEEEFQGDVALGRHQDGTGVVGVATSLANLAGISPYQVL